MPELTGGMGEEARVRRHVVVRGRVQGVWFRATCASEAEAHDVAGWIRNREDGDVEAVFEGRPEDVEAMLVWCRRGPSGARINEVVVVEEAPTGRTGFSVVG